MTTLVKIAIDQPGQRCYNDAVPETLQSFNVLKWGFTVYSKFEGLDGEKQQRIINAAMKEFAAKGFDHASTNRIVEDAGIAKGLLFHYFKSKKQLFLYLYDYGIGYVQKEVLSTVEFAEKDFFNRITKAQMVKLELIKKYPDIMDFLQVAYMEDSTDVRQELDERNGDILLNGFQKVFEDIDTSVFKPDLDISKVVKTIAWSLEGFANIYFNKMKYSKDYVPDYDAMFAEASEYVAFLKKCFYK